ncbi:MAG: AraC family transcriptional regulator ligand-binding domain-containing protein, partial [Thiohalobacterales bacterium]|nr:AraC family transcriptional regulator ligand-binding domain-containing protein [Thiohalobacterales bacterium]
MTVRDRVLASGNLASSRRTLMGILGQLSLLEMGEQENLSMITRAGLPARALAEPDFPISLQQDLYLTASLVDWYGAQQSPARLMFSILEYLGVEQLGVLGMVMRHAGTVLEALDIGLRYPQLSWGHSRLLVRKGPEGTVFAFNMERPQLSGVGPAQVDRLVEHC